MIITHHPPDDLLADFAIGSLEEAEHLVIGVHVAGCMRCSRFVKAIEQLAGTAIEDAEPGPMPPGAFDRVMAAVHATPFAARAPLVPSAEAATAAGSDLPEPLRHYGLGRRRLVAPGVSVQPIELSASGKARAFLLQSGPGTRMLEHTHSGTELTCVLKGSFSHEGGRYGPGDFDYGDDDVDHRPIVGNEGPCLCLVAMTGELKLNGFLGRLINPFVRL
jgi:putative transcriptional regulator